MEEYMSERTDDPSFQEYSCTDDEKRLFDEREKEWSNMLQPESPSGAPGSTPGSGLPQSDSDLSYNAFDSLPKLKFPKYQSGEGVYGKPV